MGLIATTHSPNAYTDEQIAEMLLVHAGMWRGPLYVVAQPDYRCEDLGIRCEYCEHVNA